MKRLQKTKQVLRSVAVGLLCFIAGCIAGCNEEKQPPKPVTPVVTAPRSDLLFCYYGDGDNIVEETHAHTNCVMAWGWGTADWRTNVTARLTVAREHNLKAIVGLPFTYTENAESTLREEFRLLDDARLLDNVIALYPIDEPDLDKSEAEVVAANAMVRKVAAEFPALAAVKLAVTYSNMRKWTGIGSYDWIGFDDYDRGESVLWNNTWLELKSKLRPDQRIIVVPGGACRWKQNPEPFVAFAQNDPQVAWVMPFLWIDTGEPDPMKGVGTCLETKQLYIDAGTRVINHRP